MPDDRTRLIELLRELSYERRAVVLASGRESNFYVDGKQTTLHAEGATLVGKLILERIRNSPLAIDGVGGLTMALMLLPLCHCAPIRTSPY